MLDSTCALYYGSRLTATTTDRKSLICSFPYFFYDSISAMQVDGHPGEMGGSVGRIQGCEQVVRGYHQGNQLVPPSPSYCT